MKFESDPNADHLGKRALVAGGYGAGGTALVATGGAAAR
jgi:hypothetical protein